MTLFIIGAGVLVSCFLLVRRKTPPAYMSDEWVEAEQKQENRRLHRGAQ